MSSLKSFLLNKHVKYFSFYATLPWPLLPILEYLIQQISSLTAPKLLLSNINLCFSYVLLPSQEESVQFLHLSKIGVIFMHISSLFLIPLLYKLKNLLLPFLIHFFTALQKYKFSPKNSILLYSIYD